MPLTPEQRSAINRTNARKSRGPQTDEGKARSRQNALKHGLRAVTPVALPNEDPAEVDARARAWDDYYRPESPAARHLVDQCVQATLLADRCQRYHAAALARQVRSAQFRWDQWAEETLDHWTGRLGDDPAEAVRQLKRTGLGCRWLIGRWGHLVRELEGKGHWNPGECDEAIRLSGARHEPMDLRKSLTAWLLRLNNLLISPEPSAAHLKQLLGPVSMPPEARAYYSADRLPDDEACLTYLREVAAEELATLRVRERSLREDIEGPDRAEAADRALILQDDSSSRLFLRYHAESRTAFQRAYKTLVQAIERDEADGGEPRDAAEPEAPEAVEAAEDTSPNEPNAEPDPPAEAAEDTSPNEPNAEPDPPAEAVEELSPNESSWPAWPPERMKTGLRPGLCVRSPGDNEATHSRTVENDSRSFSEQPKPVALAAPARAPVDAAARRAARVERRRQRLLALATERDAKMAATVEAVRAARLAAQAAAPPGQPGAGFRAHGTGPVAAGFAPAVAVGPIVGLSVAPDPVPAV